MSNVHDPRERQGKDQVQARQEEPQGAEEEEEEKRKISFKVTATLSGTTFTTKLTLKAPTKT